MNESERKIAFEESINSSSGSQPDSVAKEETAIYHFPKPELYVKKSSTGQSYVPAHFHAKGKQVVMNERQAGEGQTPGTPPSPAILMKKLPAPAPSTAMFLQIFMQKIWLMIRRNKHQYQLLLQLQLVCLVCRVRLLRSYQLHNNLRRTSLQIFIQRKKDS